MIKWVELAGTASKLRLEFLSKYLSEQGIPNQVEFVEADLSTYSAEIKRLMRDYDQIRVGSPFGEKVPGEVEQLPLTTMIQKSADCLINEEGRWWARSMLAEGLTREVALIKKLDISETAFIIGAGASCRAVISALLKMGFQKFNFTEKFEERGRMLLNDLKASYFGVDFRFTPQSAITQLPGTHSIVVNTTPLTPSNDLLNELYYCNFLKPNGVVIDLTIVPVETPLLKSALQVGGRVISGYEVAALVDCYWVKSALKKEIDDADYASKLKEFCLAQPFDLSEFEIPEF